MGPPFIVIVLPTSVDLHHIPWSAWYIYILKLLQGRPSPRICIFQGLPGGSLTHESLRTLHWEHYRLRNPKQSQPECPPLPQSFSIHTPHEGSLPALSFKEMLLRQAKKMLAYYHFFTAVKITDKCFKRRGLIWLLFWAGLVQQQQGRRGRGHVSWCLMMQHLPCWQFGDPIAGQWWHLVGFLFFSFFIRSRTPWKDTIHTQCESSSLS